MVTPKRWFVSVEQGYHRAGKKQMPSLSTDETGSHTALEATVEEKKVVLPW